MLNRKKSSNTRIPRNDAAFRVVRCSLLIVILAAFPLRALDAVTLSGRVLIQNNGPRTVLAFVESGDTGVTHVLRLTAEEPFPQNPISFEFEQATVELLPDRFELASEKDRMRIILAVLPPNEPSMKRSPAEILQLEGITARTPSEDESSLNALVLRGYWLASRTIEPGTFIGTRRRPAKVAASFCDATVSGDACDDMGGTGSTGTGPGTSCSSGGPGAVQCSCTSGTSSCSVTCGSGFYACCKDCYVLNGPSCTCVRN